MKLSNIYNNMTTDLATNQTEQLATNNIDKPKYNKEANNTGEKETIKVFVMTGEEKQQGSVTYRNMKNGEQENSGFLWDIMEEIKEEPKMSKYNFEYTFSEKGFTNYTQVVDWISEGKYDLGLGLFAQTAERDRKVEYSTPLLIDANSVFHINKLNRLAIIKKIAYDMSKLIIILLILGIITGLALYFLDPKRNNILNRKNSKKQFFFRSLLTGIATFFGEAGFLFENSTPTLRGIVILTIAMSIAMIFLLYMQGEITSDLVQEKSNKGLTEGRLSEKPILGSKGDAVTDNIENIGGKIKYIEGKTNKQLINMYLESPNKYNGVALAYTDGFPFTKSSQIIGSLFGNIPLSLIYNSNKSQFGRDFDVEVLKLREQGKLKRICQYYFGNIKNIPVCSL